MKNNNGNTVDYFFNCIYCSVIYLRVLREKIEPLPLWQIKQERFALEAVTILRKN